MSLLYTLAVLALASVILSQLLKSAGKTKHIKAMNTALVVIFLAAIWMQMRLLVAEIVALYETFVFYF